MGQLLFEGKYKVRRVAKPDEIFNILDQVPDGRFITIGYVTGADLNVPKIQMRNPKTNRMKGYDDYSVFGNENGDISALVKVSAYNFHYFNRKSMSKKYSDWYKPTVNGIRGEYGLPPIADKKNSYTQTMNYGEHGVSVYGGSNEALQGHAYVPSNLFGVKPTSVVYPVDKDGRILTYNGLSKEQILPYLKAARGVDGVSALKNMGAEEAKIEEFIKRIKDLKFSYKALEHNSILWVATTVGGEALVYINPLMNRLVNEVPINVKDFTVIAEKRYGVELDKVAKQNEELDQQEGADVRAESRRTSLRLTESELKQVIRESVINVIKNLEKP